MKKTLRISFNGKSYDVVVEVLTEEATAVASGGGGATAAAAGVAAAAPAAAFIPRRSVAYGASGDILSPLAGRVVSVEVAGGAQVRAGQPMVTLEAMKMNTVVAAPADGIVVSIHVKPGDAIEDGELLVTLR